MSTTPKRLRGFILQDRQFSASAFVAQGTPTTNYVSSYTEAGRYPGTPSPAQASDLALEASGTMPDYDINLRVQQGGYAEEGGAGLMWKKSTDASTKWRGWEPPKGGATSAIIAPLAAVGTSHQRPDAAVLPTGIMVVVSKRTKPGANGYYSATRSTAGVWSEVEISDEVVTNGQACICVRPPANDLGTAELYAFYTREQVAGEITIACVRSIDAGATWTTINLGALSATLATATYDFSYGRLRCAYSNGQIMVLLEARKATATGDYESIIIQYASADLGRTLDLVSEWDGTATQAGRYSELVIVDGQWQLYYLDPTINAGNVVPARRVVGNAYEDLAQAARIEVASSPWGIDFGVVNGVAPNIYLSDGDMGAVRAPDGTIYVFVRGPVTYTHYVLQSYDGGETWPAYYLSQYDVTAGSMWYYNNDANSHPFDFKMVCQGGRVLCLCNADSNPAALDDVLFVIPLGGWTQVQLPGGDGFPSVERYRAAWLETWGPFDLPSDSPTETVSGAGSASVAVATGYLSLGTGVGQSKFYTSTTSNAYRTGMWVLQVDDGGVTTNPEVGIRWISDTAVNEYRFTICCTTTQLSVRDDVANTTLATHTFAGTSLPFAVLYAADPGAGGNDGRVRVWVCEFTSTADIIKEDKVWTEVVSHTTLNRAASTATGHQVQWGHITAATATPDSRWWFRGYVNAANLSDDLTIDYTNPDDMFGQPIGVKSILPGNLALTGRGGPVFPGDAWTVTREHTYAVEHILATHHVSRSWRSTADGVEQVIALDRAAGLNDDAYSASGSWGLLLSGINFPLAYLEAWPVTGGAWTTVATVTCTTGLSGLGYLREGPTVKPSPATNPSARHIRHGELTGAVIDLGAGNLRRVAWNSGGQWLGSGVTATQTATIAFDGATGAEPANGTAAIWPRQYLLIVHTDGTPYRGWRLRIPSTTTLDGYYTIGKMIIGPFVPASWEWSHEDSTDIRPVVMTTDHPDGTTTRKKRGATRRAYTVSWSDGVDTTSIYRDAAPEAVVNWAGDEIGIEAGTAAMLHGLYLDDWSTELIGYVRRCNNIATTYQTSDPEVCALVSVQSGQEWGGVLGGEAEEQLVTGGVIELLEEVPQ